MCELKDGTGFEERSAADLAGLLRRAKGGDLTVGRVLTGEISDRLRARTLGPDFANEMSLELDEDEFRAFWGVCETLASRETIRIGGRPGTVQLFVIPVHGAVDEVERALKEPTLMRDLVNVFFETGYAFEGDAVVLSEDLIPRSALGLLNPPYIRDLLVDVAAPLFRTEGTGAVRDLIRAAAAHEEGVRLSEGPVLDGRTYTVRFLVGIHAFEEEDGPVPPESDEDVQKRLNDWFDRTTDLFGPGHFVIESPVGWEQARSQILSCEARLWSVLAVNTEPHEEPDEVYRDLRCRIRTLETELEVQVLLRGKEAVRFRLPYLEAGPDIAGLIEDLYDLFPAYRGEAIARQLN